MSCSWDPGRGNQAAQSWSGCKCMPDSGTRCSALYHSHELVNTAGSLLLQLGAKVQAGQTVLSAGCNHMVVLYS